MSTAHKLTVDADDT